MKSTGVFQTIKSKILLMGIFSILVAVCIGVLGINSLNRNSSNSEIGSIVNEIDVLQAKNLALEAQYQYYIDQKYLDNILGNLSQMLSNVEVLQGMTGAAYKEKIGKMLDENRYCGDILTQVAAVESALQSFGYVILKEHMETCVVEEIRKGNSDIVDEAVELMKKLK